MQRMFLAITLAILGTRLLAVPVQQQRFGKITNIEFTETAPQLEWNETKFGPRPTVEPGETFALITAFLAEGRSIGLYDYRLAQQPALALAIGTGAFNPDTWEVTFEESSGREVRLLYKIPKPGDAEQLEWTLAYEVPSIPPPQRNGQLWLVEPPAPEPTDERVNVNTATVDELAVLPGMDETLAAAVVADREANGPFAAVDDLTRVEGVDDTVLGGIRDLVDIADAAPEPIEPAEPAEPIDLDFGAEPEPEPAAEPVAAEPEAAPEPEAEPEPEAKPEPKPEPKPELKPEPKPEPKPKPKDDEPAFSW